MASYGQSVTLCYYAWNTSTPGFQTGDVANHTLKLVKDGTAASPTNSPAEVDSTNAPGLYSLVLTSAEASHNVVMLAGKSSTSNVVIFGTQESFEQLPTAAPNASGGLPTVGTGAGQINVDGAGNASTNLVNIAGAAVSTTTAQLGVNVVKYNNQTAQTDANNLPKVDVEDIKGTASAGTAGYIGPDWAHVNSPTTAVDLSNTTIKGIDGTTFPATVPSQSQITGGAYALNTDASGNVNLTPSQSPLLRTNTAQLGASGTITLDSGASATNSLYVGCKIRIRSGTGAGQASRVITAYVGSSKVATVDWAWTTAPDNTSVFDIWYDDAPALNSSLQVTFSNSSIAVSGNVTVGGYSAGEDPATLVLGATAASWNTSGTIGQKINSAGTASDPWATAVPGAYGAGTAGFLLGTNLNATVSSRSTYAGTDTPGTTTLLSRLTQIILFDGAGYVKANAETVTDKAGYTLTQSFPANFSLLSIDGSGRTDLGKILGTANAGGPGYMGIDWSAIHAPTTAVNLSGTTIEGLDSGVTVSGNVTVGGYASGQDPASLVWGAETSSFTGAGTFGKLLGTLTFTGSYLQVDVRDWLGSTALALPANFNLLSINGSGFVTFANSSIGSVTGSVGSISGVTFPANFGLLTINASDGGVTVHTNLDKTGYTCTVSGNVTIGGYAAGEDPATLVLGALAASWDTPGTIGYVINNAGGTGNPWAEDLGSFDTPTAGWYQQQIYARLAGGTVLISNPVSPLAAISIIRGYAYEGENALILQSGTTRDLATYVPYLEDVRQGVSLGSAFNVAGTSGNWTITFTFTSEETLAMPSVQQEYDLLIDEAGEIYQLGRGPLNIV